MTHCTDQFILVCMDETGYGPVDSALNRKPAKFNSQLICCVTIPPCLNSSIDNFCKELLRLISNKLLLLLLGELNYSPVIQNYHNCFITASIPHVSWSPLTGDMLGPGYDMGRIVPHSDNSQPASQGPKALSTLQSSVGKAMSATGWGKSTPCSQCHCAANPTDTDTDLLVEVGFCLKSFYCLGNSV